MRRVLLPITCVLALATGIALLLAGAMVAPDGAIGSPNPPRGSDSADAALVHRFYDALNATLKTGDPTLLAPLLAADFADRTAPPGDAATAAGLVRHVLALRATFPDLRLAAEDVQAHGDRVQARVRAEGTEHGVFLGIRFAGGPAVWGPLDTYRIAGGRIAERWASGDRPVLPRRLAQVPLAEAPPAPVVRLARLTFAPQVGEPETGLLGPLVIAAESGALTVRPLGPAVLARDEAAGTAVPRGETVTLRPGDGLVLPAGTHYVVENAGSAVAVALALALLPAGTGAVGGGVAAWPWVGAPGIGAQLLVDGMAAGAPSGPATVALGRLTLAPGESFAADGPVAPRLVIVEAGSLQLEAPGAPATTLSAGNGAVIPSAFGVTLRNAGDGPLVVLLVTVTPMSTS
jgi:predicted ester cyclase